MYRSILTGKTLVALGDSLFYGNKLGNKATWINKLGKVCQMKVYNHGMNGNTLAAQNAETDKVPMCIRFADMEDGADYVVVMGGANDKRLSVPIGDDDSRDIYTFKGALNVLIEGLTAKYPRAKILFMTTYQRWGGTNSAGHTEQDYADAMLAVCAKWAIPCFDNYRASGICFANPAHLQWMDEGISLGMDKNCHFSKEAYDWLLPKYRALLESL